MGGGRSVHLRALGAVHKTAAMVAAALLVGAAALCWTIQRSDQEQHLDLVRQAELIGQGIDLRALRSLRGTPSDQARPEYQSLRGQLTAICRALPGCRSVYLLLLRPDATAVFLADSEGASTARHHSPGQLYPDPSRLLPQLRRSERAVSSCPLHRHGAAAAVALEPLTDRAGGAAAAVLGLEPEPRLWTGQLLRAALPPSLLALVLLALALVRGTRGSRRGWRSDWVLALALGLAASAYAVATYQALAAHTRHAALQSLAAAQGGSVTEGLRDVERVELASLGSYYQRSGEVKAEEFRLFCQFLDATPAVYAWHWVPVVPAAARAAFEARARAGGHRGFAIWEPAGDRGRNQRRPAGPRDTYYPVLHVQPSAAESRALGLDLGSDPRVLGALQQAAQTGLLAVTPPLELPAPDEGTKCFMLLRPVYRGTQPGALQGQPGALQGQPKALQGFVVATLRLPEVLRPAGRAAGLTFSLLHVDGSRELLATSPAPDGRPLPRRGLDCPLCAFGKAFSVTAYPVPSLNLLSSPQTPLLLATTGLLLSLALAAAVAASSRGREQLETLVAARTAALAESEERLEQLAAQSGTITWETGPDGLYTYVSPVVVAVTGYTPEEVVGRRQFLDSYPEYERDELRSMLGGFRARRESFEGVEVPLQARDGSVRWVSVNGLPRFDEQGTLIGYRGSATDITERHRTDQRLRQNEQRTVALLQLSQMTDQTEHALTDFALERAIEITGSRIGYLAFLNDDESQMTVYSWGHAARAECHIDQPPVVYALAGAGLWGEAVRQRRPVMTNDYAAASPHKRGLPEGHVPLTRHLNVPLFDGGRIVLLVGVGNSPEDYGDDDIQQLTLLADGLWKIVQTKRAQEGLRAAEANYRDFIESMADATLVLDHASRVLFANPAALTLARAERLEDVVGLDLRSFLAPECLPAHEARMAALSRGEACPAAEEVAIATLSGEYLPFETIGSVCTYDGESAVQVVLRDLRSRRLSERIHQLYELLARHTHDIILFIRDDGSIIEANEAALTTYGYSREEFLTLGLRDLRAGEALHSVEQQMGGDNQALRFETMHRRRDGTHFPVEVSSRRVTIEGRPALLSVIRDITERRQAELRVAEQSRMLDAILTASPVGIALVRDRVLVWANKALERMLGYASAELVGEGAQAIYGEAPEWKRLGAALDSGAIGARTVEADGILVRRDGGKADCHFFARLLTPHAPARGYIIVLTDMTERRRAEEANRLASVGQLAAGVAHDFNNLLTSMLMTATLAEMGAADCGRLVQIVRKSARSGAEITGSLMAFARPDEPHRQAGRIEDSLDAALTMATRQLANAEVTVCRQYAADAWPLVFDPTQMEQVFLNLIINACHAMAGGGTLTISTQYLGGESGQAVVEIGDTGVGIPPEHLDRIFEPFFTTKGRLGESETPGSGLGLSVSHGLVAAHGGTISVTSRVGEGTTFRLCLPRSVPQAPDTAALRPESPALPPGRPQLDGARILAADDEEDVLSPLRLFLSTSGASLVAATNADEAVRALQREPFDLVVTDLMMPGGGGRAVLAFTRTMGDAAPPVIVMTGRLEPALHQDVLALGACRSIQKPFDMPELLALIDEVLAQRRRP